MKNDSRSSNSPGSSGSGSSSGSSSVSLLTVREEEGCAGFLGGLLIGWMTDTYMHARTLSEVKRLKWIFFLFSLSTLDSNFLLTKNDPLQKQLRL